MKKILSIVLLSTILTGCYKDDILPTSQLVSEDLKMTSSIGIKLQSAFITSEVTNADCSLIPIELVILRSSDTNCDVGRMSSL